VSDSSDKDEPLRADVRALGALVGNVIREQGGDALFERVEAIRLAARRRREDSGDCSELDELLHGLSPHEARELVRSFSTYFQVVNLAEQVHRIRRGRSYVQIEGPPQNGSLAHALDRLRDNGLAVEDIRSLFDGLLIEPVFTAHPTESTRRSILEKQQRIAARLLDRLNPARTLSEERAAWARIRSEVTSGWQTEEHPDARPTVAHERDHVLFYVAHVLYDVVPALHESLETALYGPRNTQPSAAEAPLVRFASWVGGDMDGNPNVDADSIRASLARHRDVVLDLYLRDLAPLARQLSQSDTRAMWSPEIDERLERYRALFPDVAGAVPERHRRMGYRALLTLMMARLEATRTGAPTGYDHPDELVGDLSAIEGSLKANMGRHAGLFAVRRVRRRACTFGFHLATLDVRQDARDHRDVVAILIGDANWAQRDPAERTAELTRRLTGDPRPVDESDPAVRRAMEVFRAIGSCRRTYGPEAIGPFIVSMAQGMDDVLTVLYLAQRAGLDAGESNIGIDVAPLFETVPDLQAAGAVLDELFTHPYYADHLRARDGRQTVMVGYSDSNKDGGLASARWSLQRSQEEMAASAHRHGARLTVFHGRGGTVSRGGGKVHRAVAASPSAALSGRLRLTEQGEVIDQKYGLPSIALRNLERMLGAVAVKSTEDPERSATPPEWAAIADTIAAAARGSYRALVYQDERFIDFFRSATPIDVIERMAIGSRPASRRSGRGIGDLRAIPWVFSWTQNRATTPGWYGVGAGLEAAIGEHGLRAVSDAARSWPFLGALLDDVEMVIAKSDLSIAEEYVRLAPAASRGIFDSIRQEFARTADLILHVQGAEEILAEDPTLRRSITLRNPYVDPMSLLQVDLLARWRASGREDDDLFQALLATVQGIARGLKNTG